MTISKHEFSEEAVKRARHITALSMYAINWHYGVNGTPNIESRRETYYRDMIVKWALKYGYPELITAARTFNRTKNRRIRKKAWKYIRRVHTRLLGTVAMEDAFKVDNPRRRRRLIRKAYKASHLLIMRKIKLTARKPYHREVPLNLTEVDASGLYPNINLTGDTPEPVSADLNDIEESGVYVYDRNAPNAPRSSRYILQVTPQSAGPITNE
jgi:hypothetical protein